MGNLVRVFMGKNDSSVMDTIYYKGHFIGKLSVNKGKRGIGYSLERMSFDIVSGVRSIACSKGDVLSWLGEISSPLIQCLLCWFLRKEMLK